MKAIHITHFGDEDNVAFVDDGPMPVLDPASNDILVRVLASALNPGDCHVMQGSVSLFIKPKQFPYVPGMDVCGIVEAVGQQCNGVFSKGDRVAVVLGPIERHGALAEYLVCDASRATLAPANLTAIQVAALPIAGTTALAAVRSARVSSGARILVLGASGGVGSLVVQIAKAFGASFVAATSTNAALVASLGADRVIDYRTTKWWNDEFGDEPLDAIIDCVGCDDAWAHCARALASHGRYVAVATTPHPSVRSVGELLAFAGAVLKRAWNPFSPSYTLVSCFPTGADVANVLALARDGTVRAVLDPMAPCAFTLTGTQRAIARLRSRHACGKLVFLIQE